MKLAFTGPYLISVLMLSGCALQRAQDASDAQQQLVGMSKSQILACMGIPGKKATEGRIEVWSYNSGNGQTDTFVTGSTQANMLGNSGYAAGTTSRRYCVVNIAIENDRVGNVSYVGPTGGLVTQGEQCAFVVQNCLPKAR
jgi:hypothetical protein